MLRSKLGIIAVCVGLGLVVAACSSSGTPSGSSSTPPASSPAATSGNQVQATAQLTFSPTTLTVKAGQAVTWMNSSGFPHTVTFDSGPAFDQQLPDGSSVSRTFSTAGTFKYHCTIHGQSMSGTIVVT
ncbi:MAG: cupredoxin domain-containing protein [Actinomycetota bacterium]